MVKRKFSECKYKRRVNAWCPSNIGTPVDYGLYSNKKFKFICFDCNHIFSMALYHIARGHWCGYCSGMYLCGESDCNTCYEKSFAHHHPNESLEWSSRNTLKPYQAIKASHDNFFFDCSICGHEYQMSLHSIHSGSGCKYCNGKYFCENLKCVFCYEKTFAFLSPERSKDWSEKNEKGPDRVFNSSNDIFLFNCKKCNHEYDMSAANASRQGCPYCAKQRLCLDSKNCHICYTKSFASFDPEKVVCWSTKNIGTPSQYFMYSHDIVLFDCHTCKKEFKVRLADVTYNLQWCGGCYLRRNKSMEKLFKVLGDFDNVKILTEVKVVCEGRSLFWDMVIVINNNRRIYIESDGPHHFTMEGNLKVSRGKGSIDSFIDQRKRDLRKEEYIYINGGLLFRFSYRQTKEIPALVELMLQYSEKGVHGVVYLDPLLYKNWEPITHDDII